MEIRYYERHRSLGSYSIERVFRDVRDALPQGVNCAVACCKFESRGLWRRLYNCVEAIFKQGSINHITGDTHYLAYFLRKKGTILTIHDCSTLERLGGLRKVLFFFFWYWLPEKRVSLISAVSEATKVELLRYLKCSAEKIRVIHDPVSHMFKPVPKSFNRQKPIILQVGTSKNKNIPRVAKALQGIPCHLRVIGEMANQNSEVLRACGIEYSSRCNISSEELVDEYRRCDMVAFVSTYEGFGLPIIEANATGRPVVTSNVLSMPEVAGNAACLVDPFDVKSISAGIVRVIQDTEYRDRLVQNGLKNVERFKPESIAMQYVGLYRELLEKQKAT